MSLGNRIRKLRKEKHMTQEELGKVLGVSKVSVSGYENGTREPDNQALKTIANFFNVSTDYLLENTIVNDPNNKKRYIDMSDVFNGNIIITFEGKPISVEDVDIIKRLLHIYIDK